MRSERWQKLAVSDWSAEDWQEWRASVQRTAYEAARAYQEVGRAFERMAESLNPIREAHERKRGNESEEGMKDG